VTVRIYKGTINVPVQVLATDAEDAQSKMKASLMDANLDLNTHNTRRDREERVTISLSLPAIDISPSDFRISLFN